MPNDASHTISGGGYSAKNSRAAGIAIASPNSAGIAHTSASRHVESGAAMIVSTRNPMYSSTIVAAVRASGSVTPGSCFAST